MTKLSVNLNKVALIRNSRDTVIPNVVDAAKTVIDAGAEGITVHPRPDQRHIRPSDVYDLAELLADPQYRDIEFNIEGNPYAGAEANGYPGFMALVASILPDQATLVPDDPMQLTSDHGWDLAGESNELQSIVDTLKSQKVRVSLFMDPIDGQIERAARLGTDRIEYYTGPYADAYPAHAEVLGPFITNAHTATRLGIGINAGHDLNLDNLETFCREVPSVAEVSIGHAIITDALWMGWNETIRRYRKILDNLK
jgi:pyridoxine 5-phosphate synthase